jgi:hypothetical protein
MKKELNKAIKELFESLTKVVEDERRLRKIMKGKSPE